MPRPSPARGSAAPRGACRSFLDLPEGGGTASGLAGPSPSAGSSEPASAAPASASASAPASSGTRGAVGRAGLDGGGGGGAPTRLYVGNLASSVDEYALLKAFERFGPLAKLDLLFHTTGPERGRPRGYGFVEYVCAGDAARALQATTKGAGATLRGQRLVVAYASGRLEQQHTSELGPRPPRRHHQPGGHDEHRTAFSAALAAARPVSVETRIAQMEAQLASIEQDRESPAETVPAAASGPSVRHSKVSRPRPRPSARNSAHPYTKAPFRRA